MRLYKYSKDGYFKLTLVFNTYLNTTSLLGLHGLMDKEPDFGSGDHRFKSCNSITQIFYICL